MTVDDVMTTLEAGERWGVTPEFSKAELPGASKEWL